MRILETYKRSKSKPICNKIKSLQLDSIKAKRTIKEIIMQNEAKFEFTRQNKIIYQLLFPYFTGNPQFEIMKMPGSNMFGSLNKGIFLFGPVGCGKSFALKTVFKTYTSQHIGFNSFQIYQYSEIKMGYATEGANLLNQFGNLINSSGGIRRNDSKTILFDDFLSNGSTASHFGNKIELADELISLRYETFMMSGKLSHFTTNIYPKNMAEHLDYRSISRLKEMCNIIAFEDGDWRIINNS